MKSSKKAYYDKLRGSTIACIGFLLSPLSWWNDSYVNLPIAYLCAWLISLFYPGMFLTAFVGSYFATNVLGFVLLHKGIAGAASKSALPKTPYTVRNFLKDLAISLAYTLLIVLLVKLGIIKPLQDYLKGV